MTSIRSTNSIPPSSENRPFTMQTSDTGFSLQKHLIIRSSVVCKSKTNPFADSLTSWTEPDIHPSDRSSSGIIVVDRIRMEDRANPISRYLSFRIPFMDGRRGGAYKTGSCTCILSTAPHPFISTGEIYSMSVTGSCTQDDT